MLVDHLMCRDGRSEESFLERRAVRTLAARQNYQTALGTFHKPVKERALPLVEDVEIDGALVVERLLCPGSSASPCFTASCCRDGPENFRGSIDDEGVETAHTCAHSTSNACTSLGRHGNATRPCQSSSYGSVHPHLAGNPHASVRASGIEKERSCPTACATSPALVHRDRSFRNWSVY